MRDREDDPVARGFRPFIVSDKGSEQRTAVSDGVSPTEWSDELRAFEHALGRIPDVARTGRWPAHPAFGPLSGHQSAALQRRHLEHHFRRFAV